MAGEEGAKPQDTAQIVTISVHDPLLALFSPAELVTARTAVVLALRAYANMTQQMINRATGKVTVGDREMLKLYFKHAEYLFDGVAAEFKKHPLSLDTVLATMRDEEKEKFENVLEAYSTMEVQLFDRAACERFIRLCHGRLAQLDASEG